MKLTRVLGHFFVTLLREVSINQLKRKKTAQISFFILWPHDKTFTVSGGSVSSFFKVVELNFPFALAMVRFQRIVKLFLIATSQ